MPGGKALLIGKRAHLYCKTVTYFKKMQRAEQLYRKIQHKYYKAKWAFEEVDRKLAMVDGRYEILPSPDAKVKKPKTIELSLEQIREVAERLGIEIEEGGEEDDT